MRLFLFLSAAFITFAFIACEKPSTSTEEKTGTLELVFKGRYSGTPMPTYTSINTGETDPTALTFKKLEFFISEIQGKKDGEMVEIADVSYVNLNSLSDATKAEEGYKVTLTNVPVGTYSQLKYGIGVPDATNATSPGEYDSNSPLGVNANYWATWNSYILCKIEGDATLANGSTQGFLYHAGVNGMYQERAFDKEFTITSDETSTVVFHIHSKDLFFKAGQEINIATDNSTHSGADGSAPYLLAKKAITNLADALHVH
ncbi:MAG: MbnP family protein [Aureispira sp.]